MRGRLAIAATLVALFAAPRPAGADATLFLGATTSPENRAVRGFGVGVSLLIIGFEFEYANTQEDQTTLSPSLRTYSGNVLVQTPPGFSGFQFYATTGTGFFRERLGNDQETSYAFNSGGGAKISLAGPLRVRLDYRIFNLRGDARHSKVQRVYAGVNLMF